MDNIYEDKLFLKYAKEIAVSIIESSPDHLQCIGISLEPEEGGVSVMQAVSENPDDFFSPNDELLDAAEALNKYMQENGQKLSLVSFQVFLKENGQWGYKVSIK
ncbi:hypothetical protein OPW36_21285 [Vibrio europaeus]|uniref:Uncharacterized protein n=1 Tax=Vibrio europaeus TaxID=300876 RepID=A0AAE7AW45_9VIBR|nr:hypothetical protein [Vibrio europaeus]MDC5806738.1 hypothetical protein [Vibrio europaeus]MDC5810140.1 hypothetical protein [Vibrio europaeus]MDC5827263.1 hypothetical protein [Vibrio europaeus]MDC5830107.1 hypothetical protein [Vibrio europaeus]MDC5836963.1 hypothetical protein [Vibrio europaeus]